MYSITLADGTVLGNLVLNGNNFISDTPLDASVFEGNLQTVRITGPGFDETFKDMDLAALQIYDGKYWFVLRQLSEQEIKERRMMADINALFATSDDLVLLMAELIGG